jgi:16S rRNA (guanine527-N7)-methyltransferase
VEEPDRLIGGARAMGLVLSGETAARLQRLLDELERWNRTYNLTALATREDMVTHHLLDSLAVRAELIGTSIADVGTGAGFPGLPLAITTPERHFTLIDSVNKKVRFVAHAVRALGLQNVSAVLSRAEDLRPAAPFDTVLARALAPLPQLLAIVDNLCGPATRVLALKGKRPEDEIAAVPPTWTVEAVRALEVPGLEAERHLVVLARGGR